MPPKGLTDPLFSVLHSESTLLTLSTEKVSHSAFSNRCGASLACQSSMSRSFSKLLASQLEIFHFGFPWAPKVRAFVLQPFGFPLGPKGGHLVPFLGP